MEPLPCVKEDLGAFLGGLAILAPGATVTLGVAYDDGSRDETVIEI